MPVVDGLLGETPLREMVRQELRLGLGRLREVSFKHLRDASMQLLAPGLEQRLVGRVLDEGVLEAVARLGRRAAAEDQL